MAATTTVLLSLAAASIAYSIARQTVMSTRSTATRVDAASAKATAEEVVAQVEAQLQASPTGFLGRVFPQERARVCTSGPHAGSAFQPGSEFPRTCGSFWTYTAPNTKSLTSVELIAPTPGDPNLYVRVLSRQPTLDDGVSVRFALDGGRRWVWASTDDLQLGSISPSGSVTVDGGMYAREGISGPAAQGVKIEEGAILATETGNATAAALGLQDVSVFTSGAGAVLNVDELQRSSLSPGSLMATAAILEDAACPGTDAVNYVGAKWVDSRAENLSSHLCLRGGEHLALSSWTEEQNDRVTIPDNVQAYAIITDSPSPGMMKVYSTTKSIDMSASSPLACTPRPSCTNAIMAAGNHPGEISFWTTGSSQLLGTFRVPVSGVVFADADVFLGVCSSDRREYALGEVCAVSSGDEPGMTISTPLTVVAGSLRSPQNVIVNSSVHPREAGQLGAVATAKAILPYWMGGQRTQAVVGVHLLAAGSGVSGSSFATFPATPLVADRFSSLVVNGSVTGIGIQLGNGLATAMTYKTAADAKGTPPWFGGSDATWRRRETLRFAGVDACDARKCTDWNTDKVQAISPGDPEPPSEAVNPDEPTGVVATPSWATNAQALVSFTSPVSSGSSPIDAYRVTCTSSDGGAKRTATAPAAPVTVANLDQRRRYSCIVEARSAAGYSEASTPSASFQSWGVPDAPSSVSVSHAWNTTNRVNEALVSFSVPASDGGLAITSYTTTCTSSDGGVTKTATGPSSPLAVSGLTKAKIYTCLVVAKNLAGDSQNSPASDPFTPIGPPDAPTFGTLSPLVRGARIDWTAPADGGSAITGYSLRWSKDSGATWSDSYNLPMSGPHDVPNLDPGGTYVFSIRASNVIDVSDWSSQSSPVVVHRAPDAPTLSSIARGKEALTATFTAPAYNGGTPVTSYEYSLDNGAWVAFANLNLTQTITGLTAGQSYAVRIRAVNATGPSPASNAVSGTPYDVPGGPTGVWGSPANGVVYLYWSAPTFDGGSPITDYVIQFSSDGGSSWSTFSDTVTTTASVTVTGLSNGTAYVFRVAAVNIAGTGANSAASAAVIPYTIPNAPTGLSVSGSGNSKTVSWTAPFNGGAAISYYQLYYATNSAFTENLSSVSPSGTSTTVSGLRNGRTYWFMVRARNAAGWSAWSSTTTSAVSWVTPSISCSGCWSFYTNVDGRTWLQLVYDNVGSGSFYMSTDADVQYLLVGGGAGGATAAGNGSAGGSAGVVRDGTTYMQPGTYSITVGGGGGAGAGGTFNNGGSGGASSFSSWTASGGCGGSQSGCGGWYYTSLNGSSVYHSAGSWVFYGGGGGAGAGGSGGDAPGNETGGNGGTGRTVWGGTYGGGGGGGGGSQGWTSYGGAGGGGAGRGAKAGGYGDSGSANLGAGGGGGYYGAGNGGSGRVMIRIATSAP